MKPIFVLFVLAGLLGACSQATEKQIGLSERVQHDDFFYSAQRAVLRDSIGSLKPTGRFWIVTFWVDNEARRVEHPWTNSVAFVTDSRGHVYENRPDAQLRLNQTEPFGWKNKYSTPAAHTDSTRLVFDLPGTVLKPYLQLQGETLMGDVFDENQFEHTKVRLFY